jgi:hypothetical protein
MLNLLLKILVNSFDEWRTEDDESVDIDSFLPVTRWIFDTDQSQLRFWVEGVDNAYIFYGVNE